MLATPISIHCIAKSGPKISNKRHSFDFSSLIDSHMNGSLNFTEHSDILYSKANQRFGLFKRTCHFVKSINRKIALYLTMVRSIFEHCPYICRPASQTTINRLESLQKRAFKWILNENSASSISYTYSTNHNLILYLIHCICKEVG